MFTYMEKYKNTAFCFSLYHVIDLDIQHLQSVPGMF